MQGKSAHLKYEERMLFVEQYLAQRQIITNSDLCVIHAYLGGSKNRENSPSNPQYHSIDPSVKPSLFFHAQAVRTGSEGGFRNSRK